MTEIFEGYFGEDLILKENFDYGGKIWRSYLVVPQEQLDDLFCSDGKIRPIDAYRKDQDFWNKISELTRDHFKKYLQTQMMSPSNTTRGQWFEWKDFERLDAAYRAFNSSTNQPLRLSVVTRDAAV